MRLAAAQAELVNANLPRLSWAAVLIASSPASAADWPQWGFDARHSSNDTAETAINRDNVARLTVKYSIPVVAPLATDAPPVYASAIATPSGIKDLLFVYATDGGEFTSTTGSLIAIDPGRALDIVAL